MTAPAPLLPPLITQVLRVNYGRHREYSNKKALADILAIFRREDVRQRAADGMLAEIARRCLAGQGWTHADLADAALAALIGPASTEAAVVCCVVCHLPVDDWDIEPCSTGSSHRAVV